MDIIIILLVAVVIVLLIVIMSFLVKSQRKQRHNRSDVHISGGVNIETGQVTSDRNYFRGMDFDQRDTLVVTNTGKPKVNITLTDNKSGKSYKFNICGSVVLGRAKDVGIVTITGDNMISHKHCELYYYDGSVYLRDLNSANHTYLNGEQVLHSIICKSGDTIKIGQTYLTIKI